MKPRHRQYGFSLPELMVAVLLGIIVTGAVIGMYLSTSRNFSQDERYALMQENGRYALRILAEDISMADFWGRMVALDALAVDVTAPDDGCATGTPDDAGTGDGIDLFNAQTALLYNNDHGGDSHYPDTTACTAIDDDRQANTDLLVIKGVIGIPDTSQVDGLVYLRSNGVDGSFVDDAASNAPGTGYSDWRYMPRIYFVRDFFETAGDGIPSLCRLNLIADGGNPTMGKLEDAEDSNADGVTGTDNDVNCIAEGIEDFHIQFGLDTDNDGVANQYESSPTLTEMEGVVSARIFVLTRSSDADPAHTDSKVFTLGDATVPADGNPFNDQFYRRVFSTTVMIRNTVNINIYGG